MYEYDPNRHARLPLDRSRISEAESITMAGIVTVALFAAAVIAIAFLVWPHGTTTTGTAVTENLPKIERPAPITSPAP